MKTTGDMKVYIDGVEINEIPALSDICRMDGWFDQLVGWLKIHRPEDSIDAIVRVPTTYNASPKFLEVWVPQAPATRVTELEGVVMTYRLPYSGS